MMMKAALHNLGCKVNAYETEAMQEILENHGYEIVPFKEGADIYIVNTCTVTNIADRKSRQMLRRAKKMNPNAIVIAAGCYVQARDANGEEVKVDESIDIIIGNNRKQNLISIIEEYQEERLGSRDIIDISQSREYEEMNLTRTGEHTRAYIKVQDGCNQFCSYCIIPYARGRVRSRRKEAVIDEVTKLAGNGYKEVVLTGIHLSSYGLDFDKTENLLSLIEAVSCVPGIERIRLGSLEPRIITDEFAKALARLESFCPHFHLSLQSGCDETLKRMNRRYDTKEYYEKCEILRKYFTHPAITTDIIVGFPGETIEEFSETKAFVERVGFYETHVFKYSKRQGTRAAMMEGQISEEIKGLRSNELLLLNQQQQKRYEAQMKGREVEILIEEQMEIDGIRYWTGYTREYIKVALKAENLYKNQIVKRRIDNQLQIVH